MITQQLNTVLQKAGAALTAFADMRGITNCPLPYAACVALPIPVNIIEEITDGPTRAYFDLYHTLNAHLNSIVEEGAQYLRSMGYQAIPVTTGYAQQDAQRCTPLPYKTVATRAGMGWIGKSCLLVTPEYGSAIRICTLLTDAPLHCGTPITQSRCGKCELCVTHCPAQALKSTLWSEGMDREELFMTETCVEVIKKRMVERTGIEATLCGKCFVVCPYTRKYMRKATVAEPILKTQP